MSSSTYKVLSQAATLLTNAAAVQAAQSAVQALTSSRRTERSVSVVSACSEVVILAQRLTELALNFPSSPSIPVISVQITEAPSVICSADELESLTSLEEIFNDALVYIVEALEAIQEQLSTLTGNTFSAETTTTTTTTKTSTTTSTTSTTTVTTTLTGNTDSTDICGQCEVGDVGCLIVLGCPPQSQCYMDCFLNNQVTEATTTTWNIERRCGKCIFPFIFYGRLIDRCTTIDGDPRPWCATSVKSTGEMLAWDWEYCTDPSCPGLEGNSEEMSVHPNNAVGNCCKFFS